MKKFVRAILAASLALAAGESMAADIHKYEIKAPSHNYFPLYPGLNLNTVEKITLQTTDDVPTLPPTLKQLVIRFADATDLVVNNFSLVGDRYRGIVNGAWVYKQVLVEVQTPMPLNNQAPLDVRLFVVEGQSNLNAPAESFGPQMFEANGILVDVTPNELADITNVTLDDKRVTLKLMQNPVQTNYGMPGFQVNATWLGHGEGTIYFPAPFPPDASNQFNAVALQIDPIDATDFNISIGFKDESGYLQTTPPMLLRQLLNDALQIQP